MSTPNKHFFYNITRKTITQFLDIFNDISIARYDDVGRIKKIVRVPIKFAPKTKQWYWNELKENHDRRDHIFPMMSINLEGMEFDKERQVNRNAKVSSYSDGNTRRTFFNPVPYNYTFKVLIVSQYMVDVLQIVEQILPNFTPEAYIRLTIPELNITGMSQDNGSDKLELRVLYDGSQKDTPVELDEEAYRVITWELTFIVQGYLFTPVYNDSIIHKVVQNYYISEGSWSKRGDDIVLPVSNIRLYTVPFSGSYDFPLSVQIRSYEPVDEIWYSLNGINYVLYTEPLSISSPEVVSYYGINLTSNVTSPIYTSTYSTDVEFQWDSPVTMWDDFNIIWDGFI